MDKVPGDVFGPSSSTDNRLASFGGTSGKIVQDSGVAVNDAGSGTAVLWTADKVASEIAAGITGLEWQDSVADRDLSTPPGSPATGDRYIVAATGLDAWAGQDNDIAEWDGAAWDFTDATLNMAVVVDDEALAVRWNGSAWVSYASLVDHAQLKNLTTGDPHTQYQEEDEKDTNGGYVGRDGSGHATITGTMTADKFASTAHAELAAVDYTQADDTAATTIASFATATYRAARIDYAIARGTTKARTGVINIIHVNGNVTISDTGDDDATGGALGLTWSAVVNGANIDWKLAVDNANTDDVFLSYHAKLIKVYAA